MSIEWAANAWKLVQTRISFYSSLVFLDLLAEQKIYLNLVLGRFYFQMLFIDVVTDSSPILNSLFK